MEADVADLLARVERLERINLELSEQLAAQAKSALSWRAALLTLGLTALFTPIAARIALPVLNPSTSLDYVSARSFTLRDSMGTTRACLQIGPRGQPALTFYNQRGAGCLNISAGTDGTSGMSVFDENGKVRLSMGSFEGGEHALLLFDEKQRRRVGLSLAAAGWSNLGFFDENLKVRASVGLRPDGLAGFRTLDKHGLPAFFSPQH